MYTFLSFRGITIKDDLNKPDRTLADSFKGFGKILEFVSELSKKRMLTLFNV